MAKKKKPSGKAPNRHGKETHGQPRRALGHHQPRGGSRPQRDSDLMRDAAPLFAEYQKGGTVGLTEAFAEILSETDDLADEPELREYFLDPAACLEAFENSFEGTDSDEGFDPTSDEAHERMLQAAEEILTPKVLGEISKRISKMRTRFTQAGDQRSVARTAVVLLALNESSDVRAGIGAMLRVVLRSVQAAMDMANQMQEMAGALGLDVESGAADEHVAELIAAGKFDTMFEQFPGMRESLEEELREKFDATLRRVQTGEIVLEVFDDGEILDGYLSLLEALGPDDEEDEAEPSGIEVADVADTWFPALRQKLEALLTPERTSRVRERLTQALEEPEFEEIRPFLTIFLDELKGEAPPGSPVEGILLSVMVGEILAYTAIGGDDLG